MKLVFINKRTLGISPLWLQTFILVSLSFLLVSCFAQQSYIGRTSMPKHVLSMSGDTAERTWQTDDSSLQ